MVHINSVASLRLISSEIPFEEQTTGSGRNSMHVIKDECGLWSSQRSRDTRLHCALWHVRLFFTGSSSCLCAGAH